MKDSTLRRSDYNYDVFISYSRKNLRFVKQVVCTLKAFGYRIWRDEEILEQYPGDPYRKHVEEGIAESALVLYIHTKASAGSAFVQEKELPYAQKRRKKIVVFRYRDTDPTGYRLPSLEKAQEIALLTPPRCTRKDPLFSTDRTYGEQQVRFMSRIRQFFEDNMQEPVTIDDLCSHLGVSKPKLYRQLKEITDYSPIDIMNLIKLRKAVSLMLNERKTISEAAYETGFNSPSYFTKLFVRYYGEKPSEYVKHFTK